MPDWLRGAIKGLSPPTRGSRQRPGRSRGKTRSIPAHAGEPVSEDWSHHPKVVYPRPRGGASMEVAASLPMRGLSPPTRGSPHSRLQPAPRTRSIPAHAGEPPSTSAVYPRPRGGAWKSPRCSFLIRGLSPPTRGSRSEASRFWAREWSIPAHAGEPHGTPRRWTL